MTTLSNPVTVLSPPQAMQAAVYALTGPTNHDDSPVPLDSILCQLEDAAEPSGGSGGAASNAYRAPAALEVLALLGDIDRTVHTGLRMFGHSGKFPARQASVQQWARLLSRWQPVVPAYFAESLRAVVLWTERAGNILTPDPQIIETRAQPCPKCGESTALVWHDELAELVQRPSLYLDKSSMVVHCRRCAATWGTTTWGLLRRMLDSQQTHSTGARASAHDRV